MASLDTSDKSAKPISENHSQEASHAKPEILKVQPVTKTKLFKIEQVSLRFSNGAEREFERFELWSPGIVMIVPMLDDNTILLVKEYAAGIEDYVVSFPKGLVHQDEDAITAANRELQEEIGYASNNLSKLMTVTGSPHYSSTRMHIVIAKDLYKSELPGDEPEPLLVLPWKLNNLSELFKRPDFHEVRCMAALYLLKEKLGI